MNAQKMTKEQLIGELDELRLRVAELEEFESRWLAKEKALEKSEEAFRLLYENAPLAYQSLDEDGCLLEINPAWSDLLGYDREEVIGKWVGDFLTPPFQEKFLIYFPQFKAVGEIHGVEFEMIRKDGARITVAADGRIRHDELGKFKRTHCILHDITEQKIAEQARERSEESARRASEEWERTFNATSDMVMILDDQHRIVRANKAMAHALGVAEPELVGECCYQLVHGEKRPPVFCPHSQLVVDGKEHSAEVVEPRLGGICDVRVSPLTDQIGQVIGSVHVTRDITERKRMEEDLRDSESRLRDLYDNAPNAYFSVGADGLIRQCNKGAEELLGYSEELLKGKPVLDLYVDGPEGKGAAAKVFQKFVSGEQVANQELQMKRADGASVWVNLSVNALRDAAGQVVESRSVTVDITERKQQEKVRLARLSLMEFADAHTLEELLQATLDEVEALTNSQIGFYHFLKADQRTLSLQAWSTNTIERMCTAEGKGLHYDVSEAGVWVDCIRERRAVIHNDYPALPNRKGLPAGHAQVVRELVVPVFRGEQIVAVLGVGNKPADYDAQDVSTVSLLADLAWDIAERKRAEEALRKSEARFRKLYDEAPVSMHAIDRDGNLVSVNRKWLDISGYGLQDALGRNIGDFGTPSSRSRAPAILRKFWRDGIISDLLVEFMRKDGTVRQALVDAVVIDDPIWGNVGVAVSSDVTERKQAERELQRSNDLLRAIIEAAPTAIMGLDLDGNVQMVWNPAAEKMLGWSAQEALGRPLPSVPVEGQEEFRGFRERIRSGKTLDGVEVRRQRRDGSPIDYSIYASPLHDAKGRITGNVAVLVDISERKRAEEQLKRLYTAVEHAGDAIVVTDAAGTILYVNPAFESSTGYERQEAVGNNPRILQSGKHDRAFYQNMWDTLLSGQVWRGRFINKKKDGTLYEETATISPIRGEDGRVINYVAVKRDVTGESLLQRQLIHAQKMEGIGTLAGGIAHDFNNLLQVINGCAEMALFDLKEGNAGYSQLLEIKRAARSAAELTQGLLTFSRRVESKLRPVDLNQELQQVAKMLVRTVPKMIEIRMNLSAPLETVNADPAQLQQVVMNLAVNARDAMPDGGTLVIETRNVCLDEEYCRSHLETAPGNYVLLSISDTGIGIDEKIRQHIFDPFFTTKETGMGTGLGLSIAFGIVKSHGGSILCYSEPGQGTIFKIYLPAIHREQEHQTAEMKGTLPRGTETILLMDDEETVRTLGETMLKKFGYRVFAASNGKDGLEVFMRERERIDLVILDLIMPKMSGRDCLREILTIAPDVRVIIASGYAANGQIDLALEEGAKASVSKPYEARQLLQLIRKVLDEP